VARKLPVRGTRFLVFVIALSAVRSPARAAEPSVRYREIRRVIKKNLHMNFHCWCWAYDPVSRKAVREAIRPSADDISVLKDLAGDSREQVGIGAVDLLEMIGEPAAPVLEQIAQGSGAAGWAARYAIIRRSYVPRQKQ
jgi:hypothetical protein